MDTDGALELKEKAASLQNSRSASFSAETKNYIKQRSYKRQSLAKTLKKIQSDPPSNTQSIEFYITKLNELKQELINLDKSIEKEILENDLFTEEEYGILVEWCEYVRDALNFTVIDLKSKMNESSSVLVSTPGPSFSDNPKLKLPPAKLPKFDGKPEEY